MSELILTDAEKAAATWLELPDETVGRLTKHTALKFNESRRRQHEAVHLPEPRLKGSNHDPD